MPAVLEGTTPTLEDALIVDDAKKRRLTRRKLGGGRGSATPSKETEAGARGDTVALAGSKKKPAAFCKSTTQLRGIIIKQCLRTEQETRSLCGAIFDTIIMATEHDVVKSMREKTRRYIEGVQAAGKGHTLGPPQICAWRGLIAGLQKQETAAGAANAVTLAGYLRQLDGVSRTYQSEQARITLAVRRTGPSRERTAIVGSSTQVRQSTTDPTVSRTPTVAGHLTRQVGSDEGMLRAVSVWLGEMRDHSSNPELVVDGAERGSATYGDGFKGERRASFSTLVSCFCGGTVLVGRCDARRKVVSLADFLDVERNPATILSLCLREFWELCLF